MLDLLRVISIVEAVVIVGLLISLLVQKVKSTIDYETLQDDIEEERVVNDSYYRGLLRVKEDEINKLASQNAILTQALHASEDKRMELVQRLNERKGA